MNGPIMKLLPKSNGSFFDDLDEHGRKLLEGCKAFIRLAQNPDLGAPHAQEITAVEKSCDAITHRVIAQLHQSFFTPLNRDDIYHLVTKMDDVMDHLEAAAERMALYRVTQSPAGLVEMANLLAASIEKLQLALQGLRNPKGTQAIMQICVEINRLEHETDVVLRQALGTLFRGGNDPLTIIMWKEIFESLESAADSCEDVANLIEGWILENTSN